MPMNEHQVTLVSAAQSGNSKCFEELYNLYYQKIFALARMTVKNEADAEDILQQTFINAWRSLSKLDDPAAFNTWIQKITLNLCYSHLRKKDIAILLDAESETAEPVDGDTQLLLPEVYAERDDLRQRLGKIIDSLSDVQKQTILLFYFNELKVDEIAEVMECSSGTVKTRLSLARKAIKSEIEEQERKSGQKFYGVAGIPLLGLSEIFAQQAEAMGLTTSAAGGILERIASTIASEAAVAAQAAAEAGSTASTASAASAASTGATAAGTAAKAGIPLATKMLAGVVAAGVVVSGAVFLPKIITPPKQMPSAIISESTVNTDELPDGDVASYYDSLSDEEKELLSQLEAALRTSDYETAHNIQSSAAFHALCDEIPDWGGFWYYPDDETSAQVYRGQGEGTSYEMALFIGGDGNGSYRLGRFEAEEDIFYSLSEATYSNGKANGAFTTHFYFRDSASGEVALHRFEGTLVDGVAQEPVNVYKEGEPFGHSKPKSHSWWPEWPEE